MESEVGWPGSAGEHHLQERYGTGRRAEAFYREQVLDHLNGAMAAFIARMGMMFVATADAEGNCDCTFRAGPPGFVRVHHARALAYPEYRGNGVMASQGNISENAHIGLMFIDFFDSTVGLHVNGRARLVEERPPRERLEGAAPSLRAGAGAAPPQAERWIEVLVEEAYIHCAKHVPLLARLEKSVIWGTDDQRLKGGDHFGVSAARRNAARAAAGEDGPAAGAGRR